jgi:predicted oxidoreductase
MAISRIKLSPDGPDFSRLSVGVWRIDESNITEASKLVSFIEEVMEMGYTTFDQADIYGGYSNEEIFGGALKLKPSLRDKMEIVTKCGIKLISAKRPEHKIKSYDTSAQHIIKSVDNSLRQLNAGFIDLLLIHRPSPLMNPDEIAETFSSLKASGKVNYFGVSNFTPSQFNMVQSRCDFPLVTNQIEASLMCLNPFTDGSLDLCLEKNIVPMVWSPFAGGKIFDLANPQTQRIQKVIDELKMKYTGASKEQILIAWLLKHPSKMLPIMGTFRMEVLKSVANAESIQLTDQEWFELYCASTGSEVA